jgi:hypothetical protein
MLIVGQLQPLSRSSEIRFPRQISIRSVGIVVLLVAIAPAWHLYNFTLYKREEVIIEEMRVKLRSLRLGGLIRVVDKEHPVLPFEANWTWYVGRHDTWLSENLPSWLHPEYYARVKNAYFFGTSDELLTIVSKFDHLTEIRIVDPKSLKSEAGKKFRERHPSVRILDIDGQLISLHD